MFVNILGNEDFFMTMTKKVAVINDLSGLGRCSLTAAISVLSAMGIQTCPLPTAILSLSLIHIYPEEYFLSHEPYSPVNCNTEWQKKYISFFFSPLSSKLTSISIIYFPLFSNKIFVKSRVHNLFIYPSKFFHYFNILSS